MTIAVVGLFHLGLVTAACLSQGGHDVIAYDPHAETIAKLRVGESPIAEPGLNDLLQVVTTQGKLTYSHNVDDIAAAEIVWITFDTPVDNQDIADVQFVVRKIENLFAHLQDNAVLIISSQVPVGTTTALQAKFQQQFPNKKITFSYMPENLRLGKSIEIFTHPDRIIIGLDDLTQKNRFVTLLQPFSDNLVWMSIVSAEMTKHAINAFLAISVTFINELADLCETVGANGCDVERGLKSEERIGAKAYLHPGNSIAGGTLMRDINYLTSLGGQKHLNTFLLSAVLESNHYHQEWTQRKLVSLLSQMKGKKIAMLGLTYKAGTDTLRRSAAIETCVWLHQQGSIVTAFDPAISALPEEFESSIHLKQNIQAALDSADAVVISTEWPEFREIQADELVKRLHQPYVLDPGGFIAKNMAHDERIKYFSVGVPS